MLDRLLEALTQLPLLARFCASVPTHRRRCRILYFCFPAPPRDCQKVLAKFLHRPSALRSIGGGKLQRKCRMWMGFVPAKRLPGNNQPGYDQSGYDHKYC